ncbi:MAG: hypothetical protein R3F14_36075 [Polyangiaceae bacterium]
MTARPSVLVAPLVLGIALSVSIPACDTSPGAGLEPFPSSGVAGFGKPQLVSVCIGAAAVTPGSSAGLCVPAAQSFAACAADDDCRAPEKCLCGRCIVRACDPSTVCPTGEACRSGRCTRSCTEAADCAAGELCSGGGCTRACSGDAACRAGEACDLFGTCSAEACVPGASCGGDSTCEPVTVSGEVREPHVTSIDGDRVAFFEVRTAGSASIYRGVFETPSHLVADPVEPVLAPPSGASRAGAPSAVVRGSDVELLVAIGDGAAVGLARSTNGGRSFTWASESLLTPSEPWESGSVGSPGAFERDGDSYFFYEGGDGAGIGLARVLASTAERVQPLPLLRPADLEDAGFWRSVQSIGTPHALVDGAIVRVYVTARGIDGGTAITPSGPVPPEPNDSIGMFATADLATFDRYPAGPVYSAISGLFGPLGEREPAVHLTPEGADLYFIATTGEASLPLGLSRASSPK